MPTVAGSAQLVVTKKWFGVAAVSATDVTFNVGGQCFTHAVTITLP